MAQPTPRHFQGCLPVNSVCSVVFGSGTGLTHFVIFGPPVQDGEKWVGGAEAIRVKPLSQLRT